jgi:hypothetical protein
MACPHTSMSAFVELIPKSTAAYSSTLLRPNLRYVVCEMQPSAPARTSPRCIVKLSFASILGRSCFSFGSSRSNDYQLPVSDKVAPHHFVLFFHPSERVLYVRNTSLQGIHVCSQSQTSIHLQTCDEPVRVVSPMCIRIGSSNGLIFKMAIPTSLDYDDNVTLYYNSLQLSPPSAPVLQRSEKRKRQGSVSAVAYKRPRLAALPASAPERWVMQLSLSVKFYWNGLLARKRRLLGPTA